MNKFLSFLGLSLMLSAAMAQSSTVTFNLNMSNETVSDGGVYLGGGVIGGPMEHELTDPDGDGIYSVSISLANGTTGNYTFLNGNCPDWTCKENIAGLPCADPGNFNDRILPDISGDVTISTCFAQCSEDGSCSQPPASSNVTFQVDMSEYGGTFGTVNLNGGFNGWCGGCAEMTDEDGDNIYEITVEDLSGNIEYKFTLDGWTAQEEFAGGEPCTLTTGEFTNRFYTVDGDATLPIVCWNECAACNAQPIPGCTNPDACNYDAGATEDDGSCAFGDGPTLPTLVITDALCHDGMGMVMMDSMFVDSLGASYMVDAFDLNMGAASLMPGMYTLIATDSAGCINTADFTIGSPEALTIAVTVVTLDSGAGDGQAEHEVTGGTPDYTVVYSTFGVAANPDSLSQGLYTATVTDANGCNAAASFTVEADQVADLATVGGSIFPVPVGDVLNVRLERPLGESAQIQVLDAQGRVVMVKVIRQGEQVLALDATSWSTGLYNIQLTTKGARASWSFVK